MRHDHDLTPEQPWAVPARVSATALPLLLKCRETLDLMLELQKLFPDLDCAGQDATVRMGAHLQLHVALAGVLKQGQEEARNVLIQWATKDLADAERLRVLLLVFGEEDGTPLPEAEVWLLHWLSQFCVLLFCLCSCRQVCLVLNRFFILSSTMLIFLVYKLRAVALPRSAGVGAGPPLTRRTDDFVECVCAGRHH